MDLVIIPARSGSKGLPGKNYKNLNGKPLIQYTIEAARNIFDDKEIVISTDSDEIIDLAKSLGIKIPFIRPKDLCGDEVGMHEVVLHALTYFENKYSKPDKIILLQPTSPFRTKNHINEAINEYSPLIDMVVSVKETSANPYFAFAAFLMAGLDGVQNKIHPGDPLDKNLYDLPPEEDAQIPTICSSLECG